MPKLLVVIASTRPGRVGLPVGQWARDFAIAHGAFDVEVADLAEINLPFMDEPMHPRLRQYRHQHTKDWSAIVDAADAFLFVMPEYNYSAPAPLINALDYLFQEWNYKPAGFVSYGGISGGTRAVQMAKQVVTTLKMVPLSEAVTLPFVHKMLDEQRVFRASEQVEGSATLMLNELARWEGALRPLRAAALQPA